MCYNLFIHSSVDGHLGCFHVLPNVKIVAVNIQFSSVAQSSPILRDPMDCSMLGFLVHHQLWSLLKLMSIESAMPYNHLILCRPLLLLPSILRSIRGFSNELVLRIRWPKYWSFSFSISPSNGYSGLIFFRMDWLDLLAWVAIPFPRGSSWPRDWTLISWIAGRFFTVWATREAPTQPKGEHFMYLIVVYLNRFSFLLLVCSSFTNFNCDR